MAQSDVVIQVKTKGQRDLEKFHQGLVGAESAATKLQDAFDRQKQATKKLGGELLAAKREYERLTNAIKVAARAGEDTKKLVTAARAAKGEVGRLRQEFELSKRAASGYKNELDKLGSSGQKAGNKIKQGFDRATASAAKFAGKLGGLRSQLLGLGVGAALGASAKAAADLDTSLRRLGTVGGDVQGLSTGIKQLQSDLGGVTTQADLAKASYQALSAGFTDTASNLNVVKAATQAAVGGLADTEQVTEVLTKTLNAFNLSGKDAISVTDSISKTVELGQVQWSDYTSQLGRVASAAAATGLSLDEVNAFIAAATKNGATAEVAFTGLGSALASLLKPSKETEEAAAALGINWSRSGVEAEGFASLLQQVATAIERNPDAAAKLLGSQEAIRGVFAAASKDGKDYAAVLDALGNKTGKTASDFNTLTSGAGGALKRFDTALKEFSATVGTQLLPALTPLLRGATELLKLFGKLPGPVKATAVAVTALAAGFVIAAPAISAAVTALKAIGVVGLVAAGKVVLIAAAVAGVALAIKALYDKWEPFRKATSAVAEFVRGVFVSLAQQFEQTSTSWSENAAKFQKFFVDTWNTIKGFFEGIGKQLQGIWGGVVDYFNETLPGVATFFSEVWTGVTKLFAGVVDNLKGQWRGFIEFVVNSATGPVGQTLKLAGINIGKSVADGIANGVGAFKAGPEIELPKPPKPPTTAAGALSGLTGLSGTGTGTGSGTGSGAGGAGGTSANSFKPSSRAQALIAAAKKLGVSPLDLATIISYETAGTFSPSIMGGAGGNYQGLIQFGPPERKQYGAHGGQSFEEQVMGPVVRFFEDRFKGVGRSTQGASLLDLYKTVNGGNPNVSAGLSDGNGTIGGHVQKMMGGHRQKALATFFGGSQENTGYSSTDSASDIAAGWDQVAQRVEQARQALARFSQGMADTNTLLEEQVQDQNEINRLVMEGMSGTAAAEQVARQRELLNIEKERKAQLEELKGIEGLTTDEIAAKEAEINQIYAERLGLQQQLNAGKDTALQLANKESGGKLQQYMTELQTQLGDTEGMIVSLAGTVESEIGGAMSNAIMGLIDGTQTAEQAFSQMFKNIGKAFIDMATQMIAKALVMKALGILGGGASGGGGFTPTGGWGNFGSVQFADGGFVSGPTPALVGEGGSNEYVIPESKMGSAMQRWNSGARGNAVVDGADPTGSGGGSMAPEQPAQINISGGVMQFGGEDYIRKDQLPSIIAQAGKSGEARALRRLQMSPTARKRVGIA